MQHHQPSTSVDSPGPDALSPAASEVGSLASGFPSASGAAFTPSSASGSGRYGGSLLAGASSLNLASPGGSNSGVAGFNGERAHPSRFSRCAMRCLGRLSIACRA
ncbi:hypothetical protein IE81DRAFT_321453 [Ceraceosorus guamensis]|uniref:Uncharacterized protein n=1 Tax=Ceraceosorus guamensis TaxID=1522189 RepID=A0A316W3L6_9BASI|nr:hypothetical protein IE81DRAFT_321453 [Ceraceosorus guamensis]PWN44299.1 hypothetical protein IE81DRAFT_321453 [Ceraceosorus guamensis]